MSFDVRTLFSFPFFGSILGTVPLASCMLGKLWIPVLQPFLNLLFGNQQGSHYIIQDDLEFTVPPRQALNLGSPCRKRLYRIPRGAAESSATVEDQMGL